MGWGPDLQLNHDGPILPLRRLLLRTTDPLRRHFFRHVHRPNGVLDPADGVLTGASCWKLSTTRYHNTFPATEHYVFGLVGLSPSRGHEFLVPVLDERDHKRRPRFGYSNLTDVFSTHITGAEVVTGVHLRP
jgi:hypothetical protein